MSYDKQGRRNYDPELHDRQGLPWTKEETEYLINWYDKIGMEEMSLALGRTEKTIGHRVYVLRKRGLMKAKGKGNTTNKRRILRSGEVGE